MMMMLVMVISADSLTLSGEKTNIRKELSVQDEADNREETKYKLVEDEAYVLPQKDSI